MTRRLVNISDLQQFTAVELLSDPGHDPSLKPIPNCMEVRLDYSLPDAKVAHNVMHARYPSTFPGTNQLANSFKTNFAQLFVSSALNASLSTSITLASVSLRDLGVLNAPYIPSNQTASLIGNDPALAMPLEVAVVLTLKTNISGPGGRGRIYMVGFTQTALASGNLIATSTANALTAFAAGLQGVFTSQSTTMCLALPSRVAYTGKTGRQHPARPAQTADITSVTLRDTHWDSQRRRGLR